MGSRRPSAAPPAPGPALATVTAQAGRSRVAKARHQQLAGSAPLGRSHSLLLTCRLLEGDDGRPAARQQPHRLHAAAPAAPVLEVELQQVVAQPRRLCPHQHAGGPRQPQQGQRGPLQPLRPLLCRRKLCQDRGGGDAGGALGTRRQLPHSPGSGQGLEAPSAARPCQRHRLSPPALAGDNPQEHLHCNSLTGRTPPLTGPGSPAPPVTRCGDKAPWQLGSTGPLLSRSPQNTAAVVLATERRSRPCTPKCHPGTPGTSAAP